MGWLEKLYSDARTSVKAHDGFIPAGATRSVFLPSTSYNYGRDIRDGLSSNVVMSPVQFIMRLFTEGEPVVERLRGDIWQLDRDHPLTQLLDQPNPFYGGDLLSKATIISYFLDGNGYWQKVRNRFGEVLQLWYLPHFWVKPVSPDDGSVFIDHYEYNPPGIRSGPIRLDPRDVVHHRFGLDPRDPRLGFSPLKPLLREVFTDEEASNFSATILRNMGVPGGIISPKDHESAVALDDEEVERLTDRMGTGFTRDKRGEWLALGSPVEIQQFGFDPNQLMLTNLRDIAEERVCAALGIPAAVVGFGSGLQQTKVGRTLQEYVKLAWISCITPTQRSWAREMNRQLVPDFQAQTRRYRVRYDNSMAAAFTEEETERARRFALLVEKGIMSVDKAQEALGIEVDASQAVYLRPTNTTPVPSGEDPTQMQPLSENGGPPDEEAEDEDEEQQVINRARRLLALKADNGGRGG